MSTSKSPDYSTSISGLEKALEQFEQFRKIQDKLAGQLARALASLEKSIEEISKLSGDKLNCSTGENGLSISSLSGTLTFAAAQGVALDSRLFRARAKLCAQFLVFGHTSGQAESTLLKSIRVYEDGLCSDGSSSWHLDDGSLCFMPVLIDMIIEYLLLREVCWPELGDFPEHIKMVPTVNGKADTREVQGHCIGFECSLPPASA